jgi:hypothetical protein
MDLNLNHLFSKKMAFHPLWEKVTEPANKLTRIGFYILHIQYRILNQKLTQSYVQ